MSDKPKLPKTIEDLTPEQQENLIANLDGFANWLESLSKEEKFLFRCKILKNLKKPN